MKQRTAGFYRYVGIVSQMAKLHMQLEGSLGDLLERRVFQE